MPCRTEKGIQKKLKSGHISLYDLGNVTICDKDLAWSLIDVLPQAFKRFSISLRNNKKMARYAVEKAGENIFFITDAKLRTDKNIIETAVKTHGAVLIAVEPSLYTAEMVKTAAENYPEILSRIQLPKEILEDKEYIMEKIKITGKALPSYYYSDPKLMLEAVKAAPEILLHAPSSMQDCREVVLEAVKQNGGVLSCVSPRLKDDKEIALIAGTSKYNSMRAPKYISARLMTDESFTLKLIKDNVYAYYFVAESLKNSTEYIKKCIEINPEICDYMEISDKELALFAIAKGYKGAGLGLTQELMADPEIVLPLVKNNPHAYQRANGRALTDTEIIRTVLEQDDTLAYAVPKNVTWYKNGDGEVVVSDIEKTFDRIKSFVEANCPDVEDEEALDMLERFISNNI